MSSNEVSDSFTPVGSSYAKGVLTGLSPNILVQRSPSHFQTGTFYWSHVSVYAGDETPDMLGVDVMQTRRALISSTKSSA